MFLLHSLFLVVLSHVLVKLFYFIVLEYAYIYGFDTFCLIYVLRQWRQSNKLLFSTNSIWDSHFLESKLLSEHSSEGNNSQLFFAQRYKINQNAVTLKLLRSNFQFLGYHLISALRKREERFKSETACMPIGDCKQRIRLISLVKNLYQNQTVVKVS